MLEICRPSLFPKVQLLSDMFSVKFGGERKFRDPAAPTDQDRFITVTDFDHGLKVFNGIADSAVESNRTLQVSDQPNVAPCISDAEKKISEEYVGDGEYVVMSCMLAPPFPILYTSHQNAVARLDSRWQDRATVRRVMDHSRRSKEPVSPVPASLDETGQYGTSQARMEEERKDVSPESDIETWEFVASGDRSCDFETPDCITDLTEYRMCCFMKMKLFFELVVKKFNGILINETQSTLHAVLYSEEMAMECADVLRRLIDLFNIQVANVKSGLRQSIDKSTIRRARATRTEALKGLDHASAHAASAATGDPRTASVDATLAKLVEEDDQLAPGTIRSNEKDLARMLNIEARRRYGGMRCSIAIGRGRLLLAPRFALGGVLYENEAACGIIASAPCIGDLDHTVLCGPAVSVKTLRSNHCRRSHESDDGATERSGVLKSDGTLRYDTNKTVLPKNPLTFGELFPLGCDVVLSARSYAYLVGPHRRQAPIGYDVEPFLYAFAASAADCAVSHFSEHGNIDIGYAANSSHSVPDEDKDYVQTRAGVVLTHRGDVVDTTTVGVGSLWGHGTDDALTPVGGSGPVDFEAAVAASGEGHAAAETAEGQEMGTADTLVANAKDIVTSLFTGALHQQSMDEALASVSTSVFPWNGVDATDKTAALKLGREIHMRLHGVSKKEARVRLEASCFLVNT